ncbi:TP901 family phage tail tape measure protein [Paenibacillus turicensis]|uniref:TP901 family phage tail tape measure protein n=1 Tax=Paenibacillus turicensis TaxID=160487 RepID=A0ABS4FW60_9BACL|nr:phage tail tape measure protein [Paenibacillus turicensis]MBP1906689.1 TP901 family phage tail tape measure protein [Paenibacillus turicensis]
MTSKNTPIKVTLDIDQKQSISQLNKAIKVIEKNATLKRLTLNLSVDTTLKEKLKEALKEQAIYNSKALAIDKAHYFALQQNAARDLDYSKQVASAKGKLGQLKSSLPVNSEALSSLQALEGKLKQITNIGNFSTPIAELEQEIASFSNELTLADTKSQTLSKALEKVSLWGKQLAWTGAKDVVKTIIEIDAQMTSLGSTMGNTANLKAMLESSQQTASQYGRSIQEVNQHMLSFAGLGYNESDTTALSNTATLFQNIANLSPEQSIQTVTAAMSAFQIEAEKSTSLADKVASVNQSFGTSSTVLSTSLAGAAEAARTYGFSIDDVLGNTAAISSVTHQSGVVISSSLQSIYAGITSLSTAGPLLSNVGISMQDVSGNLKSGTVILGELASKWSSLTQAQQTNLATQIAGKDGLSAFIALMGKYDLSSQAATTSLYAQGNAMQSNEVYMDSLSGRIQGMKTAWDGLAVSLGDGGVNAAIGLLASLLTSLTNGVTYLTEKFGALPVALGATTFVLTLLKTSFTALMTSISNTVKTMLSLPASSVSAAAGISGVNAAATAGALGMRGLGAATTAAKVAFKGLMSATVVGAVFTLIGTGLEWLINKFTNADDKQKQYSNNLNETINQSNEKINSLQNLKSALDDNSKSQEELNSLFAQSSTLLPELIDHYDSEGNAVYKSKAAIDEMIEAEKKLNLAREKRLYAEKGDSLAQVGEQVEDAKSEINDKQEQRKAISTSYEAITFAQQFVSDNDLDKLDKNSQDYVTKATELNNKIKQLFADQGQFVTENWLFSQIQDNNGLDNAAMAIRSSLSDIDNEISGYNETIQNGVSQYASHFASFNNQLLAESNNTDGNMKLFFNKIATSFAEGSTITEGGTQQLIYDYQDFATSVNSYLAENKIDISQAINNGNLNEVLDGLKAQFPQYEALFEKMRTSAETAMNAPTAKLPVWDEFGKKIGEISGKADQAANSFIDLEEKLDANGNVQGYTGAIDNITNRFLSLAKHVDDTKSGISLLERAQQELTDNNLLSASTLQQVIDKYGDRIDVTNLTRESIGELIKKVREDEIVTRQSEINKTEITIRQARKRIEMLKLQAAAFNIIGNLITLGSGKVAINTGIEAAISNEEKQINQLLSLIDQDKAAIKSLKSYSSKSSPTSKGSSGAKSTSSATPREKDQKDTTSAIINEINKEAKARNDLNKTISERAKKLEDEKRYADAISKTSMYIKSQGIEVDLLNKANQKLESERNKLQKNAGYNMSGWLDGKGEESLSFIKLYNSSSEATQKKLKNSFDKWKLLTNAIHENKEAISSVQNAIPDTEENLNKLKLSQSNQELDARNKVLEELDHNLSLAEKTQATYTEGTKEYNEQQALQNQITKAKIKFYQEEIVATEQKLKQGDLTNEQIELYNDYLKKNKLALLDAQKAARTLAETYANDIISNYKRMLEKRRDLELQGIENSIKAENERHKTYTDNLDKEQKQFEEYINHKLKLMNRQDATDDYEEELRKKLNERQILVDSINTLSLDNSMEAKAKKKGLQEQLNTKNQEIERFKLDRERELRKEGLSDQLEDRKGYLSKLQSEENDHHTKLLDNLDEQKKQTEQTYRDILTNEQKFYDMKNALLSNDKNTVSTTIAALRGEYETFFKSLTTEMFATAKELENLKYSFEQDKSKLNDYDNLQKDTGSSQSPLPSSPSPANPITDRATGWTKYLNNKYEAEALYEKIASLDKKSSDYKTNKAIIDKLKEENDQLRKQFGFADKSYADLKDLDVYHAGGEVGIAGTTSEKWWNNVLKSDEVPSILRKGEVVLNDPLSFIKEIVMNTAQNLMNTVRPSTVPSPMTQTKSGDVNIDTIVIQANDRDTANTLLDKFSTALNNANKLGIFKSGS